MTIPVLEEIHIATKDYDAFAAEKVTQYLKAAIANKGKASCILPGGSSPIKMMQHLSESTLSWKDVTIMPSDERLVPLDHPSNNAGQIQRCLMQNQACNTQLIPLVSDPVQQQQGFSEQQASQFSWPSDVTVLGMGEDGHTASLFPTTPIVNHALCQLAEAPVAPHQRVSLTQQALLQSKQVVLLVTSEKKRHVYEAARKAPDPQQWPISFLWNQDTTSVAVWIQGDH